MDEFTERRLSRRKDDKPRKPISVDRVSAKYGLALDHAVFNPKGVCKARIMTPAVTAGVFLELPHDWTVTLGCTGIALPARGPQHDLMRPFDVQSEWLKRVPPYWESLDPDQFCHPIPDGPLSGIYVIERHGEWRTDKTRYDYRDLVDPDELTERQRNLIGKYRQGGDNGPERLVGYTNRSTPVGWTNDLWIQHLICREVQSCPFEVRRCPPGELIGHPTDYRGHLMHPWRFQRDKRVPEEVL